MCFSVDIRAQTTFEGFPFLSSGVIFLIHLFITFVTLFLCFFKKVCLEAVLLGSCVKVSGRKQLCNQLICTLKVQKQSTCFLVSFISIFFKQFLKCSLSSKNYGRVSNFFFRLHQFVLSFLLLFVIHIARVLFLMSSLIQPCLITVVKNFM